MTETSSLHKIKHVYCLIRSAILVDHAIIPSFPTSSESPRDMTITTNEGGVLNGLSINRTITNKLSLNPLLSYNTFILFTRESMIYLKIKEIAEEKGVSQRQLSLRSGVDLNTVRKIFKNPYSIVTTETLDKISKVLNTDASNLIKSVDDV
jgi:DNA-binding Xre family transcriptional regulator